MKEPKELSPIEAAREIEYELLTQKLRNCLLYTSDAADE